jgi:hypothetical protein
LNICPSVAGVGSVSFSEGKRAMEDKAREVRRIAKGIYDDKERRFVLRFVSKSMKLSKEKGDEPPKPAVVRQL